MHEELYTEMALIESHFWWFRAKRRIIVSLLRRHLGSPAGRRIADIGCGTGGLLADLSRSGADVLGFDAAEPALEACRSRGFDARRCWLPDDLPLESGWADAVVMSDVLEHVDLDADTVRAAVDRLAPGGVLICTVPAHMWLWSARDDHHAHKRRYDRYGFERLFNIPGIERVAISWYMTLLFPLMIAQRAVARYGQSGVGDLAMPPRLVNATLEGVFAFERHLIGRAWMPVGASLISVHRKIAA